MKKLFTSILFTALALTATAQTYKSGVWYSLYQTGEENNVVVGTEFGENKKIFAPAAGTFQLEYRKYSNLSTTGKLEIYMAGDAAYQLVGSQSNITNAKGFTSENFKKYEGSIPEDLCQTLTKIKYKMAEGTGLTVRNLAIPLAQHILLVDSTSQYGTTSLEDVMAFDTVMVGLSSDTTYHVALRSFLSAGNIVVSSDNASFRVGTRDNESDLVFAVGANACASMNGSGDAAEGVLGDINNYGFDIFFCPIEDGMQYATITISDGYSTAYVTVSGLAIPAISTSVNSLSAPVVVTKQFRNGQIIIIRDDREFDLLGHPLH